MNNILFLSLITFLLGSCETPKNGETISKKQAFRAMHDTLIGIKGCELAKCENTLNGINYSYTQIKVSVIPSEDGVGEEIYIADAVKKDTFWIENIEAHHFAGVKQDLLFVDNGTAPNGRSVLIYDINQKKLLYKRRYEAELNINENKLNYLTPVDTRRIRLSADVCPNKDKWEKQGLGVGYGKYMAFDLATKEEIELGAYGCYPIQ